MTGILNKHSADSSLEKINDAVLDQPVLGRMLNYGDLEILTAAEEAVDRYHMLNNPKEFKKIMLTQKHNLETEFMYPAAMPPTPPLRADNPAQPRRRTLPPHLRRCRPLGDPMVASLAPPPPPLPSDPAPAAAEAATEVERRPQPARRVTGGHADAGTPGRPARQGRDHAEEYEQKKQELLGRL